VAGVLAAGIVLGHWLDPTFHARTDGDGWRRFCDSSGLPALTGSKVPAFAAIDQDGTAMTEGELRGLPWIADFIFTTCTAACPTLTARFVALQRRIPADAAHFLSFSVDPEHDRPAVLKQYAQLWHGDTRRWRLLMTDRPTLDRLLTVFDGSRDPALSAEAGGIAHSERFTLIDGEGRIRGSYVSSDAGELDRLAAELTRLRGSSRTRPEAKGAPTSGLDLRRQLGCDGCHDQPTLAAPLDGLTRRTIELADGSSALFTEEYVRESILDPAAKVVAGYQPIMPSYRGHVTAGELDAIVASLVAPH
jgi:protein SCO1/2